MGMCVCGDSAGYLVETIYPGHFSSAQDFEL